METFLSIEPHKRGTASSALISEVMLSELSQLEVVDSLNGDDFNTSKNDFPFSPLRPGSASTTLFIQILPHCIFSLRVLINVSTIHSTC